MHTKSATISRWAAMLVLLGAALLYLLTLDTGLRPDELTGGDLITHQYAQVQARPSNAPGYPLYTMGGWLWFHSGRWWLNWALNPTQLLSAYSMLWGLAALGVLHLILLDVTGGRWLPASLLTAFHATTFFFWYYSVTTEQYTSAVFQTLLVIWLAFRWDDSRRDTGATVDENRGGDTPHAPRPAARTSRRDSTLLWLAFVCGTMLANMVTTLFILPPLLWFIFIRRENGRWLLLDTLKRPKLIAQAVGLALLPLVSYTYIYLRGAQHPEWRGAGEWPSAWAWFVQFVTIQQGRDELAPGLGLQSLFTAEFPALMWQEMTLLVFAGGLLGLLFLGRRRAIFLAGTLAIYLLFCWGYRFGNWFQVIIPAYPIFTIGFGALLGKTSEYASERMSKWAVGATPPHGLRRAHVVFRWADALIAALLLALLLFNLGRNWPAANQRHRPDDNGLNPGWAILADDPPAPSAIVTTFEERVALQYLRSMWGLAEELTPLAAAETAAAPLLASRGALAAAPELAAAATFPAALGEQLVLLPNAPLTGLPPAAAPLNAPFGSSLTLAGWELLPVAALPADVAARLPHANWRLALYWTTAAPLPADYTISVRPLVNGQPLFSGDEPLIQDHQPVWGSYPTSRWLPGTLIRDVYALALPAGSQPQAVQVVVYHATAAGFENLADVTFPLTQ